MEYRILGSLEVAKGGTAIDVGGPRHRRLLAALLVHADHRVASDWLIEQLWSSPPAKASASLHVRVCELRTALRRDSSDEGVGILTRSGGYELRLGPDELDARRFEQLADAGRTALSRGDRQGAATKLEEALGTWRGPALADVADEPFAEAEISRLDALRLRALEDSIEVDLAFGRHADAVVKLRALVAEHPLQERFWCQLALALYRSSRQADALQCFADARQLLIDELGVEPGPELRRLHAAVLAQDPSLDAPAPLSPAEEPPSNLPERLTSFVGRSRELADIERLLTDGRLVTLVGTGGVGKSRVALQLASTVRRSYPGGVWLTELATVAQPDLVLPAVAATAGVREHAERSLLHMVSERLGGSPTLLVLDNCEHLLDEAATVTQQLLEACPRLTILATSRERLAVTGEMLAPLGGLAVKSAVSSEATELFLARARLVCPDLVHDDAAVEAAARVCERLDGIPLAIELAAARANALSMEEIASRLDDRLLDAGQRTTVARHQSLRAAIDWSYSLLSPAEARLFDALSVFVGGFTLAAAESVCSDDEGPEAVAGLLWRLVDKSLVASETIAGSRRYRLLETLRAYGRARLEEGGVTEQVRARHAAHYREFAEPAGLGLRGSEQSRWLNRLEVEHGNLRAALRWSVESGAAETGVRLAGALYPLWDLHGYYTEGRRWLEQVLSLEGSVPPSARGRALIGLATLATLQGDVEEAVVVCEQAIDLCSLSADKVGLAHAQQYLGLCALYADELDTAEDLLAESLQNAEAAGDLWLKAWALVFISVLDLARGHSVEAVGRTSEAELAARRCGDPECVAWAHVLASAARLFVGRLDEGLEELLQAMSGFQRLGALWGLSVTLILAGHITGLRGDVRGMVRLLSAAEALRQSVGAAIVLFIADLLQDDLATARGVLGEGEMATIWEEGQSSSSQVVVAQALVDLESMRVAGV